MATAFTPIATVHAFSAAAAITSGTKTAIDADIYQNATAPMMVQAISEIYDTDMNALHDQVMTAEDDHDLSTIADEGSVIRIHERCSLTEAMVGIQKLQNDAAKIKAVATGPALPLTFGIGTHYRLHDGSIVILGRWSQTARRPPSLFIIL